jgi:hypothetical protein
MNHGESLKANIKVSLPTGRSNIGQKCSKWNPRNKFRPLCRNIYYSNCTSILPIVNDLYFPVPGVENGP